MLRRYLPAVALAIVLSLTYACEQARVPTSATPASSAGAVGHPAFNDPVTLKVSAPTIQGPADGSRATSRNPTLRVVNASATFQPADLAQVSTVYHFRVYDPGNNLVTEAAAVPQGANGTTAWRVPVTLQFATRYTWQVRAAVGTRLGPPSVLVSFLTPDPPPPPPPPSSPSPPPPPTGGGSTGGAGGAPAGGVGPDRTIGINEVLQIVKLHHDTTRPNVGPTSTRSSRVAWWHKAMAMVIFGHPQFNPAGGDPGWCVKGNGPGRPLNDDVAVRCGSREAWDLIGGIGGPNPTFGVDFIGTLPAEQQVFHPARP